MRYLKETKELAIHITAFLVGFTLGIIIILLIKLFT